MLLKVKVPRKLVHLAQMHSEAIARELISLMEEYTGKDGNGNPLRIGLPGSNRPLRNAKLAFDSAMEKRYKELADDFWPATRHALGIIAAIRVLEREERKWVGGRG